MKVLNNIFFLILLILAAANPSWAQADLRGRILDEQNQALPFANIVLLQSSDSTVVDGVASDAGGSFKMSSPSKGSYFLKITAMGFQPRFSKVFSVNDQSSGKDFGGLFLREDRELLEEATVEALRAQVVNHGDKMVVNLEESSLAAGSNVFEMLKEAPGVWTDQNGQIQLNGKSGVKVMIDGRDTYLSGEDLQKRLQSMSAENLKNIEIISNPSAKYEAEGTAGILNIVLKTNNMAGLNGSAYGSYSFNELHLYSSGVDLNLKKDRLNAFANIDVSRHGHVRDMNWYREYLQPQNTAIFRQEGEERRIRFSPSITTGMDYKLSPNQSIGVMLKLTAEDGNQDWNTLGSLVDTNKATDVLIDSRNHISEFSFDQNYNIHYSLLLDSTGAEITANLDFVKMHNEMNMSFLNAYEFLETNRTEREKYTNHNPYNYTISAARLDYLKPLPQWEAKLELGTKASRVVSQNKLDFYEVIDAQEEVMPELSNSFTYVEEILAGYVNFHTAVNENWSVQAGVRAEYTNSTSESHTLDEINVRKYLNWFPSLFIQQKVSEDYQLSYSYSRRITRPRYDYLNPFVFYVDPYTSIQGNPLLRPQYTDGIQVTQTFWKKYNLMLGYDYTTDFLSEVPGLNVENKNTTINHGNIDRFVNISATLVVPVDIDNYLAINNTLTTAYQNFETVIDEVFYQNTQLFFNARSSASIKLPANMVMDLSANYRGPVAHGVYEIDGQWGINLGLKRSFCDDKLDVSLNVRDIFRTQRVSGTTGLGENVALIDQYFGTQSVNIGLRYNFSKGKKFQARNRKQNLEELQRAGG